MKKIIIPVIAIAMAFGTSAFTAKRATSTFFRYQGATRSQTDIQNISNYVAQASNPCNDVVNVCGVTLSTAKNIGSNPATSEFNAEKSNLWLSQQNHAPADGSISMEP
ncbi:DUF6520 family protein [Mucilaginibacter phyllosphaerae]|uniref:Uncharacterized protein n=1 Tax=Mucilaginibacter phyllosphaerae TaxID=1812349 RepID=A0A4Y8AFH1_9SPHI|nr:DUF6520 family protein [Mucilaginibacter phyllosphaerae]MBB3971288.1 hypothetical protein [Mucilaginibacter phyllosphaerae]TEW66815.1 hypothetical protein E2R65_10390 [Mucilaginibacter phyllosphaerae]GGH12095.1 hypothetical protein GCM10007352_18690 [Mucilaginibacter phyllosphaerae]